MVELLSTATIGKTHGVEGFLRVYSLSGEYAHLKKLREAVAVLPGGKEKLLSVSQRYGARMPESSERESSILQISTA